MDAHHRGCSPSRFPQNVGESSCPPDLMSLPAADPSMARERANHVRNRGRSRLRVITIIDSAPIKIIDGSFRARSPYRWPLLSSLSSGEGILLLSRNDATACPHQRRIQGVSQPRRRPRSIAARYTLCRVAAAQSQVRCHDAGSDGNRSDRSPRSPRNCDDGRSRNPSGDSFRTIGTPTDSWARTYPFQGVFVWNR